MLYLLQSGQHYKIGYTRDKTSFKPRLSAYKTHNPDFKLLGIREGSQEDEKEFHKLLKFDNKTEWSIVDETIIDNIINQFTFESYIASMLYSNVEEVVDKLPTIYSIFKLKIPDILEMDFKLIEVILTLEGLFLIYKQKFYKLKTDSKIYTFYYDFDYGGEFYSGLVVNDSILYNSQRRGDSYDPFATILKTDIPLYEKIKPILEEFDPSEYLCEDDE